VSSDAASAPQSDPETTPEEYRQRALLLADLGRYDEAVGEIAAGLSSAPSDPGLLATLARVHLAAEQPVEALVAAERAVAAAPLEINPLVVRAMALADNLRYAEAAQVAGAILGRWPADAYAQRTGAALLSEARNGQEALNAAWNGVRIAPTDGEAHLVLAVVAARLRLFDLAQQAYSEALDLDEAIGDAQSDVGVVRLERRRWALALEALADEAALNGPEFETTQETVISRPSAPVLDPSGDSTDTIHRAVRYAGNATMVAAVVTAGMTLASSGASRVWAGLIGVLVLAGVVIWLRRALTEPLGPALARVRRHEIRVAMAAYLAALAPVLLVLYAVVGGFVPLVAAIVVAAVGELLLVLRTR
jgi:tetratricopeptide (TPR) repeat protein